MSFSGVIKTKDHTIGNQPHNCCVRVHAITTAELRGRTEAVFLRSCAWPIIFGRSLVVGGAPVSRLRSGLQFFDFVDQKGVNYSRYQPGQIRIRMKPVALRLNVLRSLCLRRPFLLRST